MDPFDRMAYKVKRQDTLDMFLLVVRELREGKDITDIRYQADTRTVGVFRNARKHSRSLLARTWAKCYRSFYQQF